MTHKQEQFAQLVTNCRSQSEANRQAYNADGMSNAVIHKEASKLTNHTKVTVRIEAIQAAIRDTVQVSRESATTELEEARLKAMREHKYGAAVSAIMDKAKLHGLIVDKQDAKAEIATYIMPDELSNV